MNEENFFINGKKEMLSDLSNVPGVEELSDDDAACVSGGAHIKSSQYVEFYKTADKGHIISCPHCGCTRFEVLSHVGSHGAHVLCQQCQSTKVVLYAESYCYDVE